MLSEIIPTSLGRKLYPLNNPKQPGAQMQNHPVDSKKLRWFTLRRVRNAEIRR